MKETWLVRHAESAANAGAPTSFPDTIQLTEKGLNQAQRIAQYLDKQPTLIVVSPYLRAQQTAAPLLERFPNAILKQWEVHEFTYLAFERCYNTTFVERQPLVSAYWSRNEPYYCDGDGAESFAEFISRVRRTIGLVKSESSEFTVVFTHGLFIQAMMWLVLQSVGDVRAQSMSSFRAFHQAVIVPNAAIVKFRLMSHEDELYFGGLTTSHL